MKRQLILATIVLAGLSACTTKLDPQDRALLMDTRSLAEQSAAQSAAALAEAKAAREAAERAAMDAQNASKKSERIFHESQQK